MLSRARGSSDVEVVVKDKKGIPESVCLKGFCVVFGSLPTLEKIVKLKVVAFPGALR